MMMGTRGGGGAPLSPPSSLSLFAARSATYAGKNEGFGDSFLQSSSQANNNQYRGQFGSQTLDSSSLLYLSKVAIGKGSGGAGVGLVRPHTGKAPNPNPLRATDEGNNDRGGLRIDRVGGRPLTAHNGPHLQLSATVSPATCLEHISRRIV